jgi:NAD(P)H-flavin reductase
MCQTFVERDDSRPIIVFFGGRDLKNLPFGDELRKLDDLGKIRFVPVLENPGEGWRGESGYITAEILKRYLPEKQFKRFQYFICGPTPLMDSMERVLPQIGVSQQQIHTERFDMVWEQAE